MQQDVRGIFCRVFFLFFFFSLLSGTVYPVLAEEKIDESAAVVSLIDENIKKNPPLTLKMVLERTRKAHPRLLSLEQGIAAERAVVAQSRLFPNPELTLGYDSGDGGERSVMLSQLVELGGKRSLRQQLGALDLRQREQELALAVSEELAAAAEQFCQLLAAQLRQQLAQEEVARLLQLTEALESAIAAGRQAPLERLRLQPQLAEARLQLEMAQQNRQEQARLLSLFWGGEQDSLPPLSGELESLPVLPLWSELSARFAASPRLSSVTVISERATLTRQQEQARRLPDLTVGLGLRDDAANDEQAWLAEVALPLPLFDRNREGVTAAQRRESQSASLERQQRLSLKADLRQLWQKMRQSRQEAELLRDTRLPAAQDLLAALRYGFEVGKFSLRDLLAGESELLLLRQRYLDQMSLTHCLQIRIEGLLGTPEKLSYLLPPAVEA